MSWYSYRPYVPVAERLRRAAATAKKLVGKGRTLLPIKLDGRTIAGTFWGSAWCTNLESYSDFANRLPRGRSYVRNGSVIDLQISAGKIEALVQGADLYKVSIKITALDKKRWQVFKRTCAGKVANLLDLLQGRLSKDILADITARDTGLFPSPRQIQLECSCPDWATMCKHVAAALYGIGARLDSQPELFFTLRGVDIEELIVAASKSAAQPLAGTPTPATALADADLSGIFGVDIESVAQNTPEPVASSSARTKAHRGKNTKTKFPGKSAKPPAKPKRPHLKNSMPPQ